MDNIKNIYLVGHYGFSNYGDEAMVSVLYEKYKSDNDSVFKLNTGPNLDNAIDENHQIKLFNNKFRRTIQLFLLFNRHSKVIWGGGSPFNSGDNVFSVLFFAIIARLRRAKFEMEGVGTGTLDWKHRLALKMCCFLSENVSVRDIKSLSEIRKYKKRASFLEGDLFEQKNISKCNENKFDLLISVHSLDRYFNDQIIKKHKLTLLNSLIKYIDENNISKICIQPLCEFDKQVNYDLYKELKSRAPIVKYFNECNVNKVEHSFCISEKIYCERYHGILLAIMLNKSFFPIAYSPKVNRLYLRCSPSIIPYNIGDQFAIKFINSVIYV